MGSMLPYIAAPWILWVSTGCYWLFIGMIVKLGSMDHGHSTAGYIVRYRGIILADQLAVCQMGQAEIRILLIANHPLIFLDLDPYISSRSSSYFTGSYWFNLLFSLAKKTQSLHLFAYDCGPGLAPQPNGVKAQEQLHDTATCKKP